MINQQSIYPFMQYYMTKLTAFQLSAFEAFEYGEAHFNSCLIVSKGSVKCTYVEDYLVNKGETLVLSCHHSIRISSQETDTTGYVLSFQHMPIDSAPFYNQIVRVKPFAQLLLQLDKLYDQLQHTQHAFDNQMRFLKILQNILNARESIEELGDARTKVAESIQWMHQSYASNYSVSALAQSVNLSERQYVRIFKKITAKTPVAYMNQYRIYRAQELLLQRDDSVQKIALAVGFEDVHYFNRLFKQRVGCAPKEYIRLKQKNPRIITLHYAGELLALGITPIADLKTTLLQLATIPNNIEAVGEMSCDIERLNALQPDIVILSDAISAEEKQRIEKLVPIIVIPWDMDPTTRLQQIAKVLGKTALARQYISEYEQQRKRMKQWCIEQQVPVKTACILRLDNGKVWIHAARFFPIFYEVLPFEPSLLMQQTTEREKGVKRYAVPFDALSSIHADHIYIVAGYERDFRQWLAELVHAKQWRQLEAVQHDNVYVLTQHGIANSIYNQRHQLEKVVALMQGQYEQTTNILIGSLSTFLANEFI